MQRRSLPALLQAGKKTARNIGATKARIPKRKGWHIRGNGFFITLKDPLLRLSGRPSSDAERSWWHLHQVYNSQMINLPAKVIIMITLPFAVFLGGLWVMSKMSDQDYVTQRLLQSAAPEDQKSLQQRWGGYDADAVNRYWGALDNAALRLERYFLELDLVFPFLYGAALSASLLIAWAALGRPFNPAWLITPVAVTVLTDWTENLVQLGQLRRYVEDGQAGLQSSWIQIASAATILKMLFFLGASLFLVGLIIAIIIGVVVRALRPI
jgi:hypothetical protein